MRVPYATRFYTIEIDGPVFIAPGSCGFTGNVLRNAKEPGGEFVSLPQAFQLRVSPYKCLLGQVFGSFPMADENVEESKDSRPESLKKKPKRNLVALACATDPLFHGIP